MHEIGKNAVECELKAVEADTIVAEMKRDRVFDDFESYLGRKNISASDWPAIMISMVKDQSTQFFTFIQDNLPIVATADAKFIELIELLADSQYGKGLLWPLLKIAEKSRDVAKSLYTILRDAHNEKLREFSGLVLGGIGQIEPNYLFEVIENDPTADEVSRLQYMIALQIAYINSQNKLVPSKIVDLVGNSITSGRRPLQLEAVKAAIRIVEVQPDKLRDLVVEFTMKDDENKKWISYLFFCRFIDTTDEAFAFELLDLCSSSNAEDVVSNTISAVAGQLYKGKLNKKKLQRKALEMFKRWARLEHFQYHSSDWLQELLAEIDLEYAVSFLQNWIEEEENDVVLRLLMPQILARMFGKHINKLLDAIEHWKGLDQKHESICILTLQELVSQIYKASVKDNSLLDKIFDVVSAIARKRRIDVEYVIRELKDKDKAIKSLAILNELLHEKEPLDFASAEKNLSLIPTTVDFLGKSWFDHRIKNRDDLHPLITLLSRLQPSTEKLEKLKDRYKNAKDELDRYFVSSVIEGQFYPSIALSHLERCLGSFNRTDQGMSRMADGLRKEDSYFQTVSQLHASVLLKRKYPVILEKSVMDSTGKEVTAIDILVTIDGDPIAIEVTSLDMFYELKYVHGVIGMKNRVKQKIIRKVENQINKIAESHSGPIILLIDKSRTEISLDDVFDSLWGSLTFTWVMEKETHKQLDSYWSRKNDGLGLTTKGGERLSGVFLCTSYTSKEDFSIKLSGEVVLNPYASAKIDDSITEKLKTALFDVAI